MSKRKNNGDGTVFECSGRWYAAIQIGKTPEGKTKLKRFSAKTEREVKKKLREFKQQQGRFTKSPNSNKTTVKDYFEHWLYDYKINQLKEQSFDRLELTVKAHIIPELGGYQFASVRQSDIQDLITLKQKQGLSYSSVKKIYEALKACFQFDWNKGEGNRVIEINPVYNISIKKADYDSKKIVRVLTEEEVDKIKREIYATYDNGKRKYLYGEVFLLILNTGLRTGEVLALQRDIDLKTKKIYIGKNLILTKRRNADGKQIEKGVVRLSKVSNSTKYKASNRWIYLNDNAVTYIKNLMQLPSNDGALVVNKYGERVSLNAIRSTFKTILKYAGINDKEVGIHTLRHTFATNLFKNGVDVKVVSKILGHSSVKITYDTYIHVIESLEVEAMESIPNI